MANSFMKFPSVRLIDGLNKLIDNAHAVRKAVIEKRLDSFNVEFVMSVCQCGTCEAQATIDYARENDLFKRKGGSGSQFQIFRGELLWM